MKTAFRRSLVVFLAFCLSFGILSFYTASDVHAATRTHLRKTAITMTTGTNYQQKLFTPQNKAIKASAVTWKSYSSSVAKINSKGRITAVKEGSAKLSAKYKGKTYRFKVTIRDPEFDEDEILIPETGDTKQLYLLNAYGKRISDKYIRWSSENTDIVTVSDTGLITAAGCGSSTVIAKYKGREYVCTVFVDEELFYQAYNVLLKYSEGLDILDTMMDDADNENYGSVLDGIHKAIPVFREAKDICADTEELSEMKLHINNIYEILKPYEYQTEASEILAVRIISSVLETAEDMDAVLNEFEKI